MHMAFESNSSARAMRSQSLQQTDTYRSDSSVRRVEPDDDTRASEVRVSQAVDQHGLHMQQIARPARREIRSRQRDRQCTLRIQQPVSDVTERSIGQPHAVERRRFDARGGRGHVQERALSPRRRWIAMLCAMVASHPRIEPDERSLFIALIHVSCTTSSASVAAPTRRRASRSSHWDVSVHGVKRPKTRPSLDGYRLHRSFTDHCALQTDGIPGVFRIGTP